jgi:hypothetical protein
MAEISPLAFPKLRPQGQTPAAAPAKAEAIRAAQKAFFQAAMGGPQPAPANPAPTAAAPAPAAISAPVETGRYLRPGSRIDIKV